MPTYSISLAQAFKGFLDPVMLPVYAQVWGVRDDGLDDNELRRAVLDAMLEPARAEKVWESLDDSARGALQTLLGAGGSMAESHFERMFGRISLLGAGEIAAQQPAQKPRHAADALYYRGLIFRRFENAATGTRVLVFMPDDLRGVLPVRRTSYDHLADAEAEPFPYLQDDAEEADIEALAAESVRAARPADTSLVDDMTTLLAFTRIHQPLLEGGFLTSEDARRLLPALLAQDGRRLYFLTALAASAGLLEVQGGRAFPRRAEAQRWLNASRPEQVRALADAWRQSDSISDLAFVPTLVVEMEAGAMPHYSPAAVREAVLEMMVSLLPQDGWWARAAFINAVHEDNAGFQRPNEDFDVWYIRDAQSGQYLAGESSFDAVDGAMLDYIITGPMHWLGLMDVGEGAARFSAYGRAFLRLHRWPPQPDTPDRIAFAPDGAILVSRRVSRMERFTIARFATWAAPASGGDTPYSYRIDGDAIRQSAAQNISVTQIAGYLVNMAGGAALPGPVAALLERWKQGASASVTLESLVVLRTTSAEVLTHICNTPETRRFLGARLGETAVIVRADQVKALQAALTELGIQTEGGL